MSLIQPLKFRTMKMGCFKMPHLQMAVFQMVVIIASGQRLKKAQNNLYYKPPSESWIQIMPGGNCNPHLKNGHLQMGHFETPRFQCSELHKLD